MSPEIITIRKSNNNNNNDIIVTDTESGLGIEGTSKQDALQQLADSYSSHNEDKAESESAEAEKLQVRSHAESGPPRSIDDGTDSEASSSNVSTTQATQELPYFVRRSKVGDERETRWELYVRDEVANNETEFRSALAAELDTDDVAKTDAREYAIILAYQNPDDVADLMREDGCELLD